MPKKISHYLGGGLCQTEDGSVVAGNPETEYSANGVPVDRPFSNWHPIELYNKQESVVVDDNSRFFTLDIWVAVDDICDVYIGTPDKLRHLGQHDRYDVAKKFIARHRTSEWLYIFAKNTTATAQGVIAHLYDRVSNSLWVSRKDTVWKVATTTETALPSDDVESAVDMINDTTFATITNSLNHIDAPGDAPWGIVDEISRQAEWVWSEGLTPGGNSNIRILAVKFSDLIPKKFDRFDLENFIIDGLDDLVYVYTGLRNSPETLTFIGCANNRGSWYFPFAVDKITLKKDETLYCAIYSDIQFYQYFSGCKFFIKEDEYNDIDIESLFEVYNTKEEGIQHSWSEGTPDPNTERDDDKILSFILTAEDSWETPTNFGRNRIWSSEGVVHTGHWQIFRLRELQEFSE